MLIRLVLISQPRDLTTLASQSAGILGMGHCAWAHTLYKEVTLHSPYLTVEIFAIPPIKWSIYIIWNSYAWLIIVLHLLICSIFYSNQSGLADVNFILRIKIQHLILLFKMSIFVH